MAARPRELKPGRSVRDFYGAEIRRLRTEAGLSLVQLAGILNYSKSHLGNIETADRVVPPDLSAKLDAAFGTGGHFGRLYPLACREAHPDKYRRFMELEAQAASVAEYAAHTVPGLLQT
ncbi:helix-turn-helix domain-containing protein, partial [Streptacidiphilus griseoplanus]|uniref:helix-turn-helix domain-containing protein n=1 Tax=Peterkaempfera griseoplana TaxID=66896 RepID=UPI0012FE8486